MPAFLPPVTLISLPRPPAISPRRLPRATLAVKGSARAQEILTGLLASNNDYIAGAPLPQSRLASPTLRENLAINGQHPEVAVIACADSRVAPEIIFRAGLGQLFTIRNAGNVAWGDAVVGSVEFAVTVLQVPLVIVLGHTMCGAVGAAIETATSGEMTAKSPLANHVARIAEVIKPVLGDENVESSAVVENVKDGVQRLLGGGSQVAKLAKSKDIAVVGAIYDIVSGQVNVVA